MCNQFPPCHWIESWWMTDPDSWETQRASGQNREDMQRRTTLIKGPTPLSCSNDACNPLILTIKQAKPSDEGYYGIGITVKGQDPMRLIYLKVTSSEDQTQMDNPTELSQSPTSPVQTIHVKNVTFEESYAIETGFPEGNEWAQMDSLHCKGTKQA
ncbi:hypothetical protein XENTR_v10012930 [Xenopus tropicalis]|nr:hypothetical protein XENTR_v10012930 [Xenopus tropicalis]